MDYKVKAIPTAYNGVNYRSKLEATWAAFIDLCRWQYKYEPEGLRWMRYKCELPAC